MPAIMKFIASRDANKIDQFILPGVAYQAAAYRDLSNVRGGRTVYLIPIQRLAAGWFKTAFRPDFIKTNRVVIED